MRHSIKYGILTALELSALIVADIIILSSRPYSRDAKIVNKRIKEIIVSFFPESSGKDSRKILNNAIYKLKKDGLIDYKETSKGKSIFITQKGRDLMIKSKKNNLPARQYPKESTNQLDKSLKIIIFDIPEKERGKRDWLRAVIKNLGFKQLQQSVWSGNKPIPKEFLTDLRELGLLRFVEIFSVDKKGTIQKTAFE